MTFLEKPIRIRSILNFTRYKVSLAVTFSGFAASVAFLKGFAWSQILSISGILLLASGASAFNQYQEKEYDAKMERTGNRPLPKGEFSNNFAFIVSGFLIFAGLLLLFTGSPLITVCLGAFNIVWYNGFYTWLKRKTAFAVVPGALTGVIPVFMGWTSAGGSISDPFPLLLGFFIFMWQVPHFWLLGMMYDKDYKNAGFPVISNLFNQNQIKRIIFSWILAASLSSLLIIRFEGLHFLFTVTLILLMNAIIIFLSAFFLFFTERHRYKLLFLVINVFMLLVFCIIIADKTL